MPTTPPSPKITKLLVANRSEIATRVFRSAHEMGIRTVAIYSHEDRFALHRFKADESYQVGRKGEPIRAYLDIDGIIDIAQRHGIDGIHPGYGFLSENPDFARACQQNRIAFVGPTVDALEKLGDKTFARNIAEKIGVPVLGGTKEAVRSATEGKRQAEHIGYPVILKAAKGGGGRGMRIVKSPEQFADAFEQAQRESQTAFGSPDVFIEKLVANARHIEVQLLGDKHGNLVHLFERECSAQRRHQKIIEESPSPLLTPELRAQMGQAAINAAKAINYHNAGTVEFIFNPKHATLNLQPFYFLEMNTRLQVEHPVTELVTGLDLVHWQMRVAAGEKFPFAQNDLHQHGHAIECRVYAEDPANGFLPSVGRLLQFIPPQGPGIRVDSGFAAGDEVTHHYDPLLAKLIVHAGSRAEAIRRMKTALDDFIVHGVITNIDYMRAALETDDFKQGKVSTRWVETKFGEWTPPQPDLRSLIAAALADVVFVGGRAQPAVSNETDPFNPWKGTGNYRN